MLKKNINDSKVFTNVIDTPPFSLKTKDQANQIEGETIKKFVDNRFDSNFI